MSYSGNKYYWIEPTNHNPDGGAGRLHYTLHTVQSNHYREGRARVRAMIKQLEFMIEKHPKSCSDDDDDDDDKEDEDDSEDDEDE